MQTKERVASEAENRSEAVAQDGPATPNPRLSRKEGRVIQDRLWNIARTLHQTVPRNPPTAGNNPVKLKSCLELPHFLWVWRCKSDGESGHIAPQLYLRTLPLRHGDLQVGSRWGYRYRVAHLRMSWEPAGSEGNHSATCRATFTFNEAKNSHWWRRNRATSAIVIAKTARLSPPTDSDKGAKRRFLKAFLEDVQMLGHEAKIYDAFPAALMGYKESRSHAGVWSKPRTKLVDDPGSALVPKFYGYYTPYEPPATLTTGRRSAKIGGKVFGQRRSKAEIRSPILLIEDCGNEIKTYGLTKRDRLDVQESLMRRLHDAGFTQGSYRSRNFVVEDGLHQEDAPHYRIIDFGRGLSRKDLRARYGKVVGQREFERYVERDRCEMQEARMVYLDEEEELSQVGAAGT